MSPESTLKLFSFTGKERTLHLTWFAFFVSFLVWFNHAPLLAVIRDTLGFSDQQVKVLLILNVALTIPARIVIGMLVDRFGPRIMYTGLLGIAGLLCFAYAMANSFETMALTRFLLGFVGAGFVIGIRMIGEWFPARQVGIAEGVYGGWGNFGSAAAAMSLPAIALWFGGDQGWRYAVALTGCIALVYAAVYYRMARNTPKGATYFKPKRTGAMEVSSKGDLLLYLIMNIPMYLVLALLTWKLSPTNLGLLGHGVTSLIYGVLATTYFFQATHIYRVNKEVLVKPVPEIHGYKFKQVAVLNFVYFVTFGAELSVVSMLPLFFLDTFGISPVAAGMLAASFAFTNLLARPGGGWLSDRFGRKKTQTILLAGIAIGYAIMSNVTDGWPLALAVIATMACSCSGQAGSGAVFAMVPLIKRRMTGQIAGMTGAYGNVGAVTFLMIYSFVSPQTFFLVIAGAAVLCLGVAQLLDEPAGQIAEVLPDGTVQMIDVT